MYAFRFPSSTSNHKRSSNYLKRSLSINNDHAILNAQNRLPIAILLNQSRQVLQQQQLTTISTDKNNAIDQAVDRLDKGIALFYLLLFGSLAKWERMNNNLTKLLRRLGSLKCGLVDVYANDGDCVDPINEGYGFKALKDAINAVELSEVIVRNTSGKQTAWFLISSGDEGIIDQSGINY